MIFQKKRRIRSIHIILMLSFLWAFADGLISFYLPLQIENFTGNITLFGLLYGSYPVIGICCDFILGYFSSKIRYFFYLLIGLLLTLILAISALAPFSIALILLILIFRGAYYEFIHLGLFNYVARYKQREDHGRLFGIIYLLQDLSYTISPLLAGVILYHGKYPLYLTSISVLFIAIALVRILQHIHKKNEKPYLTYAKRQHFRLKNEVRVIRHLLKIAAVVFVGICLYYIWDSFVWALLPLESKSWGSVTTGIIIAAFNLPLAVFQSYAGIFADKFGRYITFVGSLLLASLFTILFGLTDNIEITIVSAFMSSLSFTFAYPAMLSIISSKKRENIADIAAIERSSANVGLILGPVIGGIISKAFSIKEAFIFLGVGIFFILLIQNIFFFIHRAHRLLKKMKRSNSLRFLDAS